MKLNYKNHEIEVLNDPNYTINSVDNFRIYEKVFFDGKHQEDRFYPTSKHGIIIREFGKEISSAIICKVGGATAINENSFIIEDDKIWICVCNKVYCLNIPTLELQWSKEIDSITNFSIHKIQDDFIIHGELEITRITKVGEIIWTFGGRDIWVNTEGKAEFNIESDKIRLFDFESNEYLINFDGDLIENNPKIIPQKTKKKWWNIFS